MATAGGGRAGLTQAHARRNGTAVCKALEGLDDQAALCLQAQLEGGKPASITVDAASFTLQPAMVAIKQQQKKVSGRCAPGCRMCLLHARALAGCRGVCDYVRRAQGLHPQRDRALLWPGPHHLLHAGALLLCARGGRGAHSPAAEAPRGAFQGGHARYSFPRGILPESGLAPSRLCPALTNSTTTAPTLRSLPDSAGKAAKLAGTATVADWEAHGRASVFPLLAREEMDREAQALSTQLSTAGIFNMIDTTGERCLLGSGKETARKTSPRPAGPGPGRTWWQSWHMMRSCTANWACSFWSVHVSLTCFEPLAGAPGQHQPACWSECLAMCQAPGV